MSHDCGEHSVRWYPFRHPWRYFLAAGEVRGWWIVHRRPHRDPTEAPHA